MNQKDIKQTMKYAKFFKELVVEELEDFVNTFSVSKRNIKNIYVSSPFRNLQGVAKNWDRRLFLFWWRYSISFILLGS